MKCVETGVVNPASLKEVQVLKTEIELYKTMKHDRIVSYYGTLHDSKSISIFMEYMAGVSGLLPYDLPENHFSVQPDSNGEIC